jgi:NAD(P)-dependent dehydrogenase (short-subunit alcohol dehydrogenase family)
MSRSSFLIAGGSSGLGAACARRLAKRGTGCVIADLQPPDDELTQQLGSRGAFCLTNVTDELHVRAALELAAEQFGPVRGVVICAGVIHGERILGQTGPFDLNVFRRVLEVNLVGTFNVLRLAADAMRENEPNADGERGAIITTSSVAATEGQIGQAAYAASKGGVASLTLPAARELARFGIRVVSIAPGVFETPMVRHFPEKVRQSLEGQTVFPRRLGRADEFAALVEHILDNPMLNGDTIRLDGGMRMAAR